MINIEKENALKQVPNVQPIHHMVGTNPFAQVAGQKEFTAALQAVSKHKGSVLPSFIRFADYYRAGLIDTNVLHNVVSSELSTQPQAIKTFMFGMILSLLQGGAQSLSADGYCNTKHQVLLADVLKNQFEINLPEQILEQVGKTLILYPECLESGLYTQWRAMHIKYNKKWQNVLNEVPGNVDDGIAYLLKALHVDNPSEYIEAIAINYSGWLGYLKYKQENNTSYFNDYVLIWLLNEFFYLRTGYVNGDILQHQAKIAQAKAHVSSPNTLQGIAKLLGFALPHSADPIQINLFDLKNILLIALEKTAQAIDKRNIKLHHAPKAQTNKDIWLFCMDPRSERVRKIIEDELEEVTYGCAGFFNVPLQVEQNNEKINHFPGQQSHHLTKQAQQSFYEQLTNISSTVMDTQRKRMPAAFLHYELFGLFYLLESIANNLGLSNQSHKLSPQDISESSNQLWVAAFVSDLLKSIGLVNIDAQNVYIVSHGANVNNNHYASTLQCAACNGNHGSHNADFICQYLNKQENCDALKSHGVVISPNTVFVPLKHNTAKDELQNINVPKKSNNKQETDKNKLSIINKKLSSLTSPVFPETNKKNSHLWAKLVPEFGLCNHTNLIIGPRWLTQESVLHNRSFLHSYDYTIDEEGDLLAAILSGPAFVAHELNMQYFFSTSANHAYGSGDKTRHSTIASTGALEGDSFDLKYGLPLQSVEFKGKTLHVPTRLRIYIYAPQNIVRLALTKAGHIAKLQQNNWLFIESLIDASND